MDIGTIILASLLVSLSVLMIASSKFFAAHLTKIYDEELKDGEMSNGEQLINKSELFKKKMIPIIRVVGVFFLFLASLSLAVTLLNSSSAVYPFHFFVNLSPQVELVWRLLTKLLFILILAYVTCKVILAWIKKKYGKK